MDCIFCKIIEGCIPSAKVSRAKAMLANGYSRAEVCDMLDISESKLINALDL